MGINGGCLCGALRYQIKGSPFLATLCHCDSCRRATGGAVTGYIAIGRGQIRWVGRRSFHRSSPGVTRGHCGACGTPLHYMTTVWPGEIHINAATLDDLTAFQPTAHVHWAQRVPWLDWPDALPRYAGRAP